MYKIVYYQIIIFILIPFWAFAFDNNNTHRELTEKAVESNEHLKNVFKTQYGLTEGFDEVLDNGEEDNFTVSDWLQEGSYEEDEPTACRAANHFHNPLLPWQQAKLTDNVSGVDFYCENFTPYKTKYSNLIWATGKDDKDQNYYNPPVNSVLDVFTERNGRNWDVARQLFYFALAESDPLKRARYLAETFKTIGYIMHLLQDMAVPAHTRNDFSQGHSRMIGWPLINGNGLLGWLGNPFEDYVKDNFEKEILPVIAGNLSQPYIGEKVLTNFWDTDTVLSQEDDIPQTGFDIGLAEYSNANFVSIRTIFKDGSDTKLQFQYPSRDSIIDEDYPDRIDQRIYDILARDGKLDKGVYIAKNGDGEKIDKFLKPRYIPFDIDPDTYLEKYYLKFMLDNQCYLEYAKKLIPRAIGYSASLLEYFFRGKIDIQRPIVTIGPDSSVTGIDFSIRNGTHPLDENQTVEPFESGTIEFVYSYIDPNNPDGESRKYHNHGVIYTVSGPTDLINTEYIPITVSLPLAEQVPAGAKDFSFTLVFKGKLGNESNAVAGQVYQFDNSRIAYFHQPDGKPNTSNIFHISPDGSYPYQITEMEEPNPWYFSPAWSKDGTMLAFEEESCTAENYDPFDPDVTCPMENYSRNIVVTDLLSDQSFPNNVIEVLNYNDNLIANASFSPDGKKVAALMADQSPFYYFGNIVVFDRENNSFETITPYNSRLTDLYGAAPAWSPAGDTIAYYLRRQYDEASSSWQFEGDLYVINSDGTNNTRLTNDDFINTQPSWSPDGEQIVFSSDRDGEESMDIWLMDKWGISFSKLVDCTPASCYSPTFSPDGLQVAFSNGSSIYTIYIDGESGSQKNIAEPGPTTGSITWSPFLAPPSLAVQAEPQSILAYGTSIISWQSNGATEVFISGIAEKQPPNGSIAVSPGSTETYTLTAVGKTGTAEKDITITVPAE